MKQLPSHSRCIMHQWIELNYMCAHKMPTNLLIVLWLKLTKIFNVCIFFFWPSFLKLYFWLKHSNSGYFFVFVFQPHFLLFQDAKAYLLCFELLMLVPLARYNIYDLQRWSTFITCNQIRHWQQVGNNGIYYTWTKISHLGNLTGSKGQNCRENAVTNPKQKKN